MDFDPYRPLQKPSHDHLDKVEFEETYVAPLGMSLHFAVDLAVYTDESGDQDLEVTEVYLLNQDMDLKPYHALSDLEKQIKSAITKWVETNDDAQERAYHLVLAQ